MIIRSGTLQTIPRNAPVLSGLGDTYTVGDQAATDPNLPAPSAWDNFMSQAPSFIKDLMAIKNTQDLYNLNIDRAKAGLAPITASAVSPTVNVGLAPSSQNALLMVAGIGALFLILKKRRKG